MIKKRSLIIVFLIVFMAILFTNFAYAGWSDDDDDCHSAARDCSAGTCVSHPGCDGAAGCSSDTDCRHSECENYACVERLSTGTSTCTGNPDCDPCLNADSSPKQCAAPANICSQIGVCVREDNGNCRYDPKTYGTECGAGLICDGAYKCFGLTGAFWTDLVGKPVNMVYRNSTVILKVTGEGMQDEEINYSIYKDVPWWFNKKVSASNQLGYTTWFANEPGTFYFKANIARIKEQLQSGNLIVNESESNKKPIPIITAPAEGSQFKVGTPVFFNQSSYDEDDTFTATWDFGDGTSANDDYPGHTNNTFATPGVKNVRLNIRDARGAENSAQVTILIAQEGFVYFPYISQPKYGYGYAIGDVSFNATKSEVLNCSSVNNGGPLIGDLYCPNLAKENVKVFWDFNGETTEGNWSEYAYFKKRITGLGEKTVKLKLGVGNTWDTNMIEVKYKIFGCGSDGQYFDDGSGQKSTIGDFNCKLFGDGRCCPNGYSCQGTPDDGRCVNSNKSICNDYKTQGDCNSFNPATASYDVEVRAGAGFCSRGSSIYTSGALTCQNSTSCSCYWDAGNATCKSTYQDVKRCYNPQTGENYTTNLGNCVYSDVSKEAGAQEGCTKLVWSAVWVGGEGDSSSCKGGEDEICVATMPFFSFINIIVSILILGVIYYILIKRK